MSSLMIRDIAALVTCNDADEELHHVDLFCENGRIAAIGPELTQHADRVINGAGMFCYPGLINTHHHLYQQFSRNLAKVQNLELFDWLKTLYEIWKRLDETVVRYSSLTGMGELMKNGCTTCFDHHYVFPANCGDLIGAQSPDGAITCTAPYIFGCRPADPVCSSYLLAGWEAWLHTGNLEILEEGFEGFAAWNAFLRSHSENGIVDYSYYGDWAAPAYACQSEEFAVSAVTPGILMSTGYYYFNSRLLAQIAGLLGKPERAEAFRREAEGIREAFLKKWWNAETGCVGTGSQGCQSFALWLDILPAEGRYFVSFLYSLPLRDKTASTSSPSGR